MRLNFLVLSFVFQILSDIVEARVGIRPLRRQQQTVTNTSINPFSLITPSTKVEWTACYTDSPAAKFGGVSCARLIAPLDYDNLTIGTIQLAIIKLIGKPSNETRRTVFFNVGGPGGEPVDYLLTSFSIPRTQVGNETDIIAVVPRAVGSTFPPVTCETNDFASIRRSWDLQSTLPGYTNISIAESHALGREFGLDCAQVTPDLVPYVGTTHAARDMDFVLQAMGLEKMSYLGYSYGTVLGGTYAALYPHKIARMVLDGVLNFNDWYSPNKDPQYDIGDADLALDSFFQLCYEAGSDHCAIWSNSTESIRMEFLRADGIIHNDPLPVAGRGLLKWPLWRMGVYSALYKPAEGFPLLAAGAFEILNGTAGPGLEAYLDLVNSTIAPSPTALTDPETGLKNSPNAGLLIQCLDNGGYKTPTSHDNLTTLFTRYQNTSSLFASVSSQYVYFCLGANLTSSNRYTALFKNITTSLPILFVGNAADPTTPLRNAELMNEAFPGSGLLTINGTGHISISAVRNADCATKWILPYFRDGLLPPDGKVCDGMQNPFGTGR